MGQVIPHFIEGRRHLSVTCGTAQERRKVSILSPPSEHFINITSLKVLISVSEHIECDYYRLGFIKEKKLLDHYLTWCKII